MRRVVGVALAAAGLVVGLTGCGAASGFAAPETTTSTGTVAPIPVGQDKLYAKPFTFYTALPDGTQVLCIAINANDDGAPALSCDWDDAQHQNKPAPER